MSAGAPRLTRDVELSNDPLADDPALAASTRATTLLSDRIDDLDAAGQGSDDVAGRACAVAVANAAARDALPALPVNTPVVLASNGSWHRWDGAAWTTSTAAAELPRLDAVASAVDDATLAPLLSGAPRLVPVFDFDAFTALT